VTVTGPLLRRRQCEPSFKNGTLRSEHGHDAPSVNGKLDMVLSANHTARLLALTGLRERFPGESPAWLQRRLADLWLGPELAAKAYGSSPEHE
jgi:hypothetical protein